MVDSVPYPGCSQLTQNNWVAGAAPHVDDSEEDCDNNSDMDNDRSMDPNSTINNEPEEKTEEELEGK